MNVLTNEHASALEDCAGKARKAARVLARASAEARDEGLRCIASAILRHGSDIHDANLEDLARADVSDAFRDRLTLTEARIAAMAKAVADIAALPDPLSRTPDEWTRPNGLVIKRVPVPIGVIGMIYESRPNVGADAAAICLKSGNAVILRGGSDSFRSAAAIHCAVTEGLQKAGLPVHSVQVAPTTDRDFVAAMLTASGRIDLIIPRGGKSLVKRVQHEARVPVLAHAEGLCHTYIHSAADPEMARRILLNAKMRRTGICGATETLLIDAAIAQTLLPILVADLAAAGCAFHADERARAIVSSLPPAAENDFDTEWLDAIISIAVVDDLQAALAHIERHGSAHTEAIVTQDEAAAAAFLANTDSAVAMWNTSTQFCDGGEFGFGAEIGISTGRIQARGPVGPQQLTCFRYTVTGTGQVRE